MTVIGEAYVLIRPDSKGFAGQAEKEVESGLGGAVKKAALLVGGAMALGGAKEFVSGIVDAARESEKMQKQTAAVLQSTGSVAGVTADQVDKLATSLSNMTGIDDEAIQNNENLLLTFTKVRNEVGKGNDIFNRATAVSLDMAKALGTDVNGSVIQIGKALNDPIRGLTALTRVGVTFTDQQREQVKAMVESGNTLGAQRIILDELTREFGGSAAAQATAGERLAVVWDNVQETLGKKLLPIIDTVAEWLADRLPGAIDNTLAGVDKLVGGIADFIEGFTKGTDEIGSAQSVFAQWGAVAFTVFERVKAQVVPIVEQLARVFREQVKPVLIEVGSWLEDHWKPVLIGVGAAIFALTAPITALVAGLALLYVRNESVRNGVQRTIDTLRRFAAFVQRDVVPPVVAAFRFIEQEVTDVVRFFSERFAKIEAAVRNVLFAVKVTIAVALAPILYLVTHFGDEIESIIASAFDQVQLIVSTAFRVIGDLFDFVIAILTGQWGDAWAAIADIPAAMLDYVQGSIDNAFSIIENLFSIALGSIGDLWSTAWSAIRDAAVSIVTDAANEVTSELQSLVDFVTGLPGTMMSAAAGLWDWLPQGLRAAIDTVIDLFNKGIDFLNSFQIHVHKTMPSIIPNIDIDWDGLGIPHIPQLASGALVKKRPGGVVANIAEGMNDEAVLPLPPGLLEGLLAIAQGKVGTTGNVVQGPLIGSIVSPQPFETARQVVRRMRQLGYEGAA